MQKVLSLYEIKTLLKETMAGTNPHNLPNIYTKLQNKYGNDTDMKIKKMLIGYKSFIEQSGGDQAVKTAAIKNLIDVINSLGPIASKNLPQLGDALTAYAITSANNKSNIVNPGISLGSDNYHTVLELLKKIVPIVNPGMKRELLNILLNYYNIPMNTLTSVQMNALLAILL